MTALGRVSVSTFVIEAGCSIAVAHLSDLHLPIAPSLMLDVAAAIREHRPDMLLFTGDYVSSKRGLEDLRRFLELVLRELPRARVFGCLGNWDRRMGIASEVATIFRSFGGRLLVNDVTIAEARGCRVCIVGLDDGLRGSPDLSLSCSQRADLAIALVHEPAVGVELAKRSFEGVILAGHCHGGQVKVFGHPLLLPPMCPRRFYEGVHRIGRAVLLVSPGLGTSLLPLRIGCPPAIYVVRFVEKNDLSRLRVGVQNEGCYTHREEHPC